LRVGGGGLPKDGRARLIDRMTRFNLFVAMTTGFIRKS
jgi:hypothetical protein